MAARRDFAFEEGSRGSRGGGGGGGDILPGTLPDLQAVSSMRLPMLLLAADLLHAPVKLVESLERV
eukprot:754994-Hanusia_phi.AAC.12